MNKRVKELAEQAGFKPFDVRQLEPKFKTFAELIVKDCISTIENAENGYQDYRNQIENGMRKHCIWLIKDKFGVES